MRVESHREFYRAMPHDGLSRLRMDASGCQQSPALSTQGMEIEDASRLIDVRDLGFGQVFSKHITGPICQPLECPGGGQFVSEIRPQFGCRVRPQWQGVSPAILLVPSLQLNGERVPTLPF